MTLAMRAAMRLTIILLNIEVPVCLVTLSKNGKSGRVMVSSGNSLSRHVMVRVIILVIY